MRRPYVVYKEGLDGIRGGDPVPAWLLRECVYKNICQCHLVGSRRLGWHRKGALYSNVASVCHQMYEGVPHGHWLFLAG